MSGESDEELSRMSTARTLNLEYAVLIVIQYSCGVREGGGGGGASDKFVIPVVKMVYNKMSV